MTTCIPSRSNHAPLPPCTTESDGKQIRCTGASENLLWWRGRWLPWTPGSTASLKITETGVAADILARWIGILRNSSSYSQVADVASENHCVLIPLSSSFFCLLTYLKGGSAFVLKTFFFLMWTILKVFIKFVTVLLLFYALVFGCQECEILVPWPGIELKPSALEGKESLKHWTTREVPAHLFLNQFVLALPPPKSPSCATCPRGSWDGQNMWLGAEQSYLGCF